MGISYEDVPVKHHSEVAHPGHPAIIDTALLATATAKLTAGTILKADASGEMVAADTTDTPVAVLAEDSDGKNPEVLVIWHGMVVQGRLSNLSEGLPVAVTPVMTGRLRAAGIYPAQLFTSAKKG